MRFVGVSGQAPLDEMAAFVDDHGVADFDHVADLRGQLWAIFGVNVQPSYVFINDDGVVSTHVGGMEPDELEEQIELLVAS